MQTAEKEEVSSLDDGRKESTLRQSVEAKYGGTILRLTDALRDIHAKHRAALELRNRQSEDHGALSPVPPDSIHNQL